MRALVAFLALCLAACLPARAEELVVALSQEQVAISSNFSGVALALFGAIERDAQTVARPHGYDVVVVVRGPDEDVVTRRKERFLGLWINRESRRYNDVPSFYAVLSSRPLDDIASPGVLRQLEVGLENIALATDSDHLGEEHPYDSEFAESFLRLKQRALLYYESDEDVRSLSRSLFTAQIPLPANVPVGQFTAEVHLFSAGVRLAAADASIQIDKTGFEQFVSDTARHHPALYGLAGIAIAFLIGWLASVLFRRD